VISVFLRKVDEDCALLWY